MNTQIITQKFFKDATGKIWCIDIMKMNQDSWESEIQDGWMAISKDEADKIANPPPTKAQLIEQADAQKQYLIAEAHTETEMLRTKLALERIKEDEKALLNAWLDYLDLLEAVDTSTAPDIDWPVKLQ
ncbi:tail fiber assembly protein [Morganella morganii]|uniref:tail fiber assembly protein n=1 Tax=Morganella morganii TaxID=582 RepID=UPI0016474B21|nr:tail fiber assembly protein [Morganella morganii]MBC3968178.1 tail fiber assembly protein [Morganella morganii]HDT0711566.1 tail fiber assembly protein [Morganella morganii subsp. morganii]HDT4954358.1 tail fiber assembly protein [Morganella morganii subsp. morganii]HEI8451918.1 tail fiber assembly protein [Morganella morganii]